ncbi:hypothetical protein H0H93_011800, partial [Arthromyces matolae]
IALPNQSIAYEKDDDTPTTKRKLTFEDLVSHTRHYNAATRRDALLGFQELFGAKWDLLDSSLATLLNTCVRLIADEDASVRKALLTFFTWILPRIPQANIVPHSPLLLLFTTSAQTHIFPEIRIDAIRFLDLFLECIPHEVIAGWNEDSNGHGSRVLEGYLGILNAGTRFGEADGPVQATSTASVVLTPASKLVVLHSVSTFLQSAVRALTGSYSNDRSELSNPLNTWFLSSSFARTADYHSFEKLLQPSVQYAQPLYQWRENVDPEDNDDNPPGTFGASTLPTSDFFTLQKLSDISNVFSSSSEHDPSSDHNRLARTLQSTLIATFLDCAPSIFTPNGVPAEIQLKLVVAVSQIAHSLYGVILRGSDSVEANSATVEDLHSLLGYMTPYFPFNLSGVKDIKAEQAFQDLNLIFCELTSLLLLATNAEASRLKRRGKTRQTNNGSNFNKGNNQLTIQTQRVSEYILQILGGQAAGGTQLGRALTPAAYVSLLPAIWGLMNNITTSSTQQESTKSAILDAVISHSLKTSSKSSLKRVTIEFVARLVLLSSDARYRGHFRFDHDPKAIAKVQEWVSHLPRSLWEIAAGNISTSEIITQFLLRSIRQRLGTAITITDLRSKLVPFFTINHPARGQLPGPYSKIPGTSPLKRLTLDLAAWLMVGTDNGSRHELLTAVDQAVIGTEQSEYWTWVQNLHLS